MFIGEIPIHEKQKSVLKIRPTPGKLISINSMLLWTKFY
jgi:hypothetical protein